MQVFKSIQTFATCLQAPCNGFLIGIMTVAICFCGLYSVNFELRKPRVSPTLSDDKRTFIANNRFQSSAYREYVSQTFVNHVENNSNVIDSYCTHFFKVEFDSFCEMYDIKYSLDTDIVYNYYPKISNITLNNFNTSLYNNISQIYSYCKYKYPIDNSSIGYVYKLKKNVGKFNIISNTQYWQKRFFNKTIVFFGDSMARRLGYQLRSLINGKHFTDDGYHGQVEMHLNNSLTMQTNIMSSYKPCTEDIWKFSYNTNYEKLTKIYPKPIDYFVLIVKYCIFCVLLFCVFDCPFTYRVE